MSQPKVLAVRPRPSRGLGAFYRNLHRRGAPRRGIPYTADENASIAKLLTPQPLPERDYDLIPGT
jgi:hypothetical protein